MKISVQVSNSELESMLCESVQEFEQQIRMQLDDAISDDEGNSGSDWMIDYDLEISVVNSYDK